MQSDIVLLRSLKQLWFPGDRPSSLEESLGAAFDEIGFTEPYVDHVLAHRGQANRPRTSKVIKDSVWGMVEVDWRSVRLLDCPIVQRLRGVRQLGFSFLTYPSAEHSRFVHSLGMFAVVSRFLDSMRRPDAGTASNEEHKPYEVGDELRLDLAHAAILHDCGHMPFSHASEAAMVGNDEEFFCGDRTVAEFRFEAEDILKKSLQLSELLSLVVVLSPRFTRFYSDFVRDGLGEPDRILRVAALIAGMRPETRLRGAAELISNSAVDADKVDYINRDAIACGIPVGIDVARLFLRSAFLEVKADRLAALLRSEAPSQDEVIFVVNASGVDTMEELAAARASLYQRVYLHQTTRNAERLLARCLEELPATQEPLRDAVLMLGQDDSSMLRALAAHGNERVTIVAQRLRNRELPKRACAFGRTMIDLRMPIDQLLRISSKDEIAKQVIGAAIERLRQDPLRGKQLSALEERISQEALEVAKTVRSRVAGLAPDEGVAPFVTVLPMTELKGLRKDCIVLENNELVHSSRRIITDELMDATDIYKSLGYVLTEPIWKYCVFIAARKIIAKATATPSKPIEVQLPGDAKSSVKLSFRGAGRVIIDRDASARRAGLDPKRLAEIESFASAAGYFDDAPWLLPVAPETGRRIAEKFRVFDGQHGWSVRPVTVNAFIAQFPPHLRDALRRALEESFSLLDRAAIREAFLGLIQRFSSEVHSKVWITGLTPDSGSFVRNMLEQELREQFETKDVEFAKSVEDALSGMGDDEALLLCDDNISSGSQAQCQFRAWCSIPRESWPEDQRSETGIFAQPLSRDCLEKLKKVRLAIGVCAGFEEAQGPLSGLLTDAGISGFVGVRLSKRIDARPSIVSPELHTFLRAVGRDVLAYARYRSEGGVSGLKPEQAAFCERNSGGYGDVGALVSTPFSVPTATYPAFWCPGFYQGAPWMPLFVRRGYTDRLVVG